MRRGKKASFLIILAALLMLLCVGGTTNTVKTWKYQYGDETIVVKNSLSSCEMLINDSLVDKKDGLMYKAELTATLKNGEAVRAELGGAITINCTLYIDNILQEPLG